MLCFLQSFNTLDHSGVLLPMQLNMSSQIRCTCAPCHWKISRDVDCLISYEKIFHLFFTVYKEKKIFPVLFGKTIDRSVLVSHLKNRLMYSYLRYCKRSIFSVKLKFLSNTSISNYSRKTILAINEKSLHQFCHDRLSLMGKRLMTDWCQNTYLSEIHSNTEHAYWAFCIYSLFHIVLCLSR